jgi:oxygen-dependent protoporphyrinogen oxidase
MNARRVVVIGGGVAGVAAARRLSQRSFDVVLIEQGKYLGGRVRSPTMSGVTIEAGAQFVTNFYTNTLALMDELGLRQELREINRDLAIAKEGQVLRLASSAALLGTHYLSVGAKLRLGRGVFPTIANWRRLDFHDMARAGKIADAAVSDVWTGPLGRELCGNLIGPVLDGFLYWAPETTSSTMLMILLKAGARLHRMYMLPGGLQTFVERSAEAPNIDIRLGAEVTRVVETADGYVVTTHGIAGETTIAAQGVVCATPATTVTRIIADLSQRQRDFFDQISYSSTVSVACRMGRTIEVPAFATMLPTSDGSPLAMINVLSKRQKNELPAGRDVVSLFASGKVGAELCALPDEDVVARLTNAAGDAASVFDCECQPGEYGVYRWPEALPRFVPGYLARLHDIDGALDGRALVFAGDYLGGPFVEGAVSSGLAAGDQLAAKLSNGSRLE